MNSIKTTIVLILSVLLTACTGWRSNHPNTELVEITGTVQGYNLDRKGNIDSVVLNSSGKLAQINLPKDKGSEVNLAFPFNSLTTVNAFTEKASKDIAVFSLSSYQTPSGIRVNLLPSPEENTGEVDGVVTAYNLNRHGDVDALVLTTGDFIEIDPKNFKYGDFPVGMRIKGYGTYRTMLSGRKFIRIDNLNG